MAPSSSLFLVWSIAHAIRHPSHESVAWIVCSLLLFLTIYKARSYALKAQDRVIPP